MRRLAAGRKELPALASELVGVTAALADNITRVARKGKGVVRLGVPETAKAPVAAALAARHTGPALILVPTPARANAVYEELSLYLEDVPLARLAERESLPYELVRDDRAVPLDRSRALNLLQGAGRALVVASWAALSERCAPPDADAAGIEITQGARLQPEALARALEERGYAASIVADEPGRFARRGGIFDVFGAAAEGPIRIEFFGDDVESIRSVDVVTQRSIARAEQVHLAPMATGTHQAHAAAAALRDRIDGESDSADIVREQLELIASGERSAYAGFLEPLLSDTTGLDHVAADALVIFDDAEDGADNLASIAEYEDRTRAELEDRGAIPSGLPALRTPAKAFEAALSAREPAIHLLRFGSDDDGTRRVPLQVTPGFAGKLRALTEQTARWAKDGRGIVIASQQALRLHELFTDDGVPAELTKQLAGAPSLGSIVLVPVAATAGFVVPDQFTLITDAEIFGFRKRRRPGRQRGRPRSDVISDLEVGDYLVHSDHGIARFGGIVRRSVEHVEREYLELQYAEGDRIYVPADQVDTVSRYVGPSDHPPTLTRLGSQDWARAKRRVRQSVIEMAQELLELYAKRELARGHAFAPDGPWQMEMEAAFPFVETHDQLEAIAEVKSDMERSQPMDRLICGDVGYGKTEVAVRAAFKAVADGHQVAVLVPTTVLAEQHGATFRERVAGFPMRVEVLSRFRSEQQQQEIVSGIANGEVDIAIGTHRLLQRDVHFKELGLVVIDEEQRFGVSHKERLKQMRAEVDVLTLSATPIPRTLQMSLVGIRDMSSVMTPPEERLPIQTYVLQWDDQILREAIDRELQRGGQVYLVHNRVHNIERVVARVQQIVPEARIIVGHGQMHEDQLERVMLEFAAGEHDILVCTTIIESGLDIPNANTIIINDADRLGLAQLYQLRGRVGRATNRAYAYLLYDRDRSITEQAQKRLEAIFEASELGAGFQIALRDLEIRGAGNVLGNEQSGHIAAVGFELYAKLVSEAVAALKATMIEGKPAPPPEPPAPSIDLPLSAHIPENYIDEVHARLAMYQRIAAISSAEGIAEMQAELADRFGTPPRSVENLLYVALVRSLAKAARVESVKTDDQMFHLRVRGGVTPAIRRRVEALGLDSVLVGPNQVRLDRVGTGTRWMQLLVRVLRAMVDDNE
ncbi:MAG TPA: transcription-repair coupling factor [Tepidiformaceae bacterium]|nr:transcription-repair coupling factor [Tepidiformaceae bacterium]